MTPELEAKLKEKYPTFFRDLYGDPTKTCMSWGIEAGDGWYDLIVKLCDDIVAAKPPENFCFA
jgi:hypothetical protein